MRPILVLAGVCALLLAGCGKFFQAPSGGTPTPGSAANNLYVVNPGNAATNPGTLASVAGFAVGASTLTALPGSPYVSAAGVVGASCVALTPKNTFLYEGTALLGIFLYTVNNDGSLTLGNGNAAVATGFSAAAMAVDPSGSWLIVVDQLHQQVLSYSINPTTGVLSTTPHSLALHTDPTPANSYTPNHLAITPSGQLIYVSLGRGGVDALSFDATTGTMALLPGPVPPKAAQGSDQGTAIDLNGKYLFVAETAGTGLRQFTIGAGGALAEPVTSPQPTGVGPSAVLVDSTGSYVYVSNRTDGTITGYALTGGGSLIAINGSPFPSGAAAGNSVTTPLDMVEDNTKSYIAVVNNGGGPDLQLFKIDTTIPGKLIPVASTPTGADPTNSVAIAATH